MDAPKGKPMQSRPGQFGQKGMNRPMPTGKPGEKTLEGGKLPGKRMSYYGTQLSEKQKAKEMYGMREKQFRRFFGLARKMPGDTGANLVVLLERRLDSAIYRLGWAATRKMARQMVTHRHLKVNDKFVKSPSYLLREGDEITFRVDKMPKVIQNMEFTKGKIEVPKWLSKSKDNAKVGQLPTRKDLDVPLKENLIVELYSK